MKKPIFTGSAAAVATPFTGSGVDFPALRKHLDFLLENGTDALVVCGTTGEAATMSYEERMETVEAVVRHVDGRVPVIAGTGSNNTENAIALSKDAVSAGADGLLVVTPFYNKATQRGLIRHFAAVADSAERPVILYNVPSRTGVKCAAETYAQLAGHPNIQGVKEASGDLALVQKTRELCPEDFYIWSGNDDETAPIMLLGGSGVISVAANVVPQEMHQLTASCLSGDFVSAGKLQLRLRKLCEALFWEVNPIPVKTAMSMMGFCQERFRLPMCEMEEENRARLRTVLAEYGLVS
ncbi:MAG: 4-hydroxy-tetrahydrodipicolinate synthase [Oscillospiraceae bacterium]|nr:4-hydroxy-tetrahydrodipicolinate synthase [Oscillospiraceae bacterium]MCI9562607.1 4-hydroxy-tetrahydrodipicolinate synthase [Oscillospiraceae bacterium]